MSGGYWGGVNQHDHSSAGAGGSGLPLYQRVLARLGSTITIVNSTAITPFLSTTLPAGILPARAMKFDIFGAFQNATGVAQNTPTFTIVVGGLSLFAIPVVSVATNATLRMFTLSGLLSNSGVATNYRASHQLLLTLNNTIELVNHFSENTAGGPDFTVDNSLVFNARHTVANASLSVRIDNVVVSLI